MTKKEIKFNNDPAYLKKMVEEEDYGCVSVGGLMKRTVGISKFVKRQTKDSEFTHFDGTWDQLGLLATELLEDNYRFKDQIDPPMVENGYRKGVILIHIPNQMVHGFSTYTDFPMFEGMNLSAEYEKVPGREHEPAKVRIKINELKRICEFVDLILYSHEVLEEDNDASTGCNWEIVSINGRQYKDTPPMEPMTIVRNWKHLPGGTKMKDAKPEDVLEMLCQSIMYKNGIKNENK